MSRYMRRSAYWTPGELTGAIVCVIGAFLIMALLWRIGLFVLVPFVMVAIAGGWAWAITPPKGSRPGLPPPPIEPAMRPAPLPRPPVRRSGSKVRRNGGSLD
jgi:hypothetical protein